MDEKQAYVKGVEDGRRWAGTPGRGKRPQWLQLYLLRQGPGWDNIFAGDSNFTAGDRLLWAVGYKREGVACKSFWATATGDQEKGYHLANDRRYLEGFADGAIAEGRPAKGQATGGHAVAQVRKEHTMDEKVVERLRESKRKLFNKGREDGRRWASDLAEWEHLKLLENFARSPDWDTILAHDGPYRLGEHLLSLIGCGEAGCLGSLCEEIGGEDGEAHSDSRPYVEGLAAGALEVWDEVKDKV